MGTGSLFKISAIPFDRPVIPLVLSLIVGIIIADVRPGFHIACLAILMGAMIRVVYCLFRQRSSVWAPLIAAMAAGYLSLMPWLAPRHSPTHVTRFLDSGRWQIRARVVDQPVYRLGRTRFVAAVQRLSRAKDSHQVSGRIRLTVMGDAVLMPGDLVSFTAHLRSFHNFRNPGGFDYCRYMAFQRIHGSAWVRLEKLSIASQPLSRSMGRLIQDARWRLARMIDASGGPGTSDEKSVLKALVVGDRSGIDDDLRQRFNRAGVGHLLAISGLHVGIVAALAFGLLRWFFSFIPALLWRGWGRLWAAGATLFPVLAYGLLAGMSPSTQRAVIMVAVFLFSLMLGRARDTLNTLAVAALIILVVFPPSLFSISFQLSFAAVLVIVVGLQRFEVGQKPGEHLARKTARWLIGSVLVSVLAVAGTTPVVLYHFNQTSLVGVVANVLLIPLIGFAAVPMGLVCAVTSFLFEPLAMLGFPMVLALVHAALMIINAVAALPFAASYTVSPSVLEIGVYYAAGWSLLNWRRISIAPWILTMALIVAVGDGLYWTYQRFWHRDFRITAIDVGQGASTLMEFPGGTVMLMDGGGFSDNRIFDMGQRVVAPLLWRKKIARVDILALSHPNADHLNGLIFIARHFHVRELWLNGDVNTTWGYKELMDVCREKGIAVRILDTRTRDKTVGGVTLSVLHPPPGYAMKMGADQQDRRNNASLVVHARLEKTAFLFTGDIMVEAEKALVQREGLRLASTVLFAPHHGSRTSSSADLIAAVQPQAVVISAGVGNRFGFPHAEVTDRYRGAGCLIWCTCIHGAVTLSSDGNQVQRICR